MTLHEAKRLAVELRNVCDKVLLNGGYVDEKGKFLEVELVNDIMKVLLSAEVIPLSDNGDE